MVTSQLAVAMRRRGYPPEAIRDFIDRVGVMVSIVVCLTILAVALVANLVGSLMPLLAKRLGLDPTVMASPLISTILDAVSLILFFNIAVAVLNM